MKNFSYTIMYVADVEKTLDFYHKSFGFEIKFITPDKDYGELATNGTTLSFAQHKLASSNLSGGYLESSMSEKPFGIEIGITTDNVEEVINLAIQNGAVEYESVKTKPWGQVVGYVRDINGFLVEICTPIK